MLNTFPATDVCSAAFVPHITERVAVMVMFRIQELSHLNIGIVPPGLRFSIVFLVTEQFWDVFEVVHESNPSLPFAPHFKVGHEQFPALPSAHLCLSSSIRSILTNTVAGCSHPSSYKGMYIFQNVCRIR